MDLTADRPRRLIRAREIILQAGAAEQFTDQRHQVLTEILEDHHPAKVQDLSTGQPHLAGAADPEAGRHLVKVLLPGLQDLQNRLQVIRGGKPTINSAFKFRLSTANLRESHPDVSQRMTLPFCAGAVL